MRILPPGPWLPSGTEAEGTVDIGIRLREAFYTKEALVASRESLGHLLPVVLHHEDYEAASRICQAWLETWPAAALVDDARVAWTQEPSAETRAVLERVTELHALARGWPVLESGMALMPDGSWLAGVLRETGVVVSRGEADGSEEIAAMLGTTVGEVVYSDEELPEAMPSWADRLWPAPAQEIGERVHLLCHTASLPGSPERLARGDKSEVGWLLWDGPHPPRPVHPGAMHLLESIDEASTVEELVLETGWGEDEVRTALESLASAGALGS
ncbi:MAG: hypothetical protein KC912_14380 [Proteobacteria bacterium]|nr:hypothetical protein [Pseudomonadota bacterium]